MEAPIPAVASRRACSSRGPLTYHLLVLASLPSLRQALLALVLAPTILLLRQALLALRLRLLRRQMEQRFRRSLLALLLRLLRRPLEQSLGRLLLALLLRLLGRQINVGELGKCSHFGSSDQGSDSHRGPSQNEQQLPQWQEQPTKTKLSLPRTTARAR